MRPSTIVPNLFTMRRWLLVAILLSGLFQCSAQTPASADPALKALFDRGNHIFYQGTAREQKVYHDSLAAHLPTEAHQRTLARVFIARGLRAQGMARQALQMLDSLQDEGAASPVLIRYALPRERARGLKQLKMFPEALAEAQRSLDVADSSSMGEEAVDAIVLLAELHRAQSEYERALALLIEAEERAAAMHYAFGLCNIAINRGNLLSDQDRYEEARKAFKNAHDCAQANRFPEIASNALFNEAAILTYAFPDSIEVGMVMFQEELVRAQASGDREFEVELLREIGRIHKEQGRYRESVAALRASLAISSHLGDTLGQAAQLLFLSGTYLAEGRLDSALLCAERSMELSERARDAEGTAVTVKRVADVLTAMGRYQEAGKWFEEYITRQKAVTMAANSESIQVMEYRFETAKKENTIMLQDEQIESDRVKKHGMLAIAVLLLLVSGLVVRNNQHMRRVNAQQRELHEREVNDLLTQQEIKALDAMMQGQEAERDRIARDLHDRLGSMLSAVKLQFGVLEGRMGTLKSEQEQQYHLVFGMLDEAVSEVRRISHDLAMTSLSRFGLKSALEDLRATLHAPGKLEVEMSLFRLEERLDQRMEVAIYRIVQECISNALKHAQASTLSIQLTRSAETVNVIVEDNGAGFDPAQVKEGLGMGNLRKRAAEIGGRVNIDSRIGRGTTVNIDIPLTKQGA